MQHHNKGMLLPPEVYTPQEIQAMMSACNPNSPTGAWKIALIVLLYRGGLRITEALALKPKDLDPLVGTVTILKGKGKKYRTIGLDARAFFYINNWLEKRKEIGIPYSTNLFCSAKGDTFGQPFTTNNIRRMLKTLGRKAGIQKRVHAHAFRHTHAAELAREGTPMNIVQQQLGHSNLATTDRYLRHIAPKELIDTMRARSDWEV